MSHYIKDYSSLDNDPVAKQALAIQDIKDYLGAKKFKQVCKLVHADQTATRTMFIRSLSAFVGIEGYPAEAWADELGLAETSPEVGPTSVETACKAAPEA